MKRSGFTLVELIFVIVIIGVLSAVAIPKFANLKGNAEAANTVKIIKDAMSSIPSAAINKIDLESNSSFKLSDIAKVTGKGWKFENEGDGNYTYTDPATGGGVVASMQLGIASRELNVSINCANFANTQTKIACSKDLNSSVADGTTSETLVEIIQF